jgi:hypothetical protein
MVDALQSRCHGSRSGELFPVATALLRSHSNLASSWSALALTSPGFALPPRILNLDAKNFASAPPSTAVEGAQGSLAGFASHAEGVAQDRREWQW